MPDSELFAFAVAEFRIVMIASLDIARIISPSSGDDFHAWSSRAILKWHLL